MSDVDEFERHRALLFSVAYRMLGRASEAEEVVQDAWLRAAAAADDEVRSPRAYLTTIVTRLALDRLKSARVTRERYVGPWLPEPVLTDGAPGPEQAAELSESLGHAFLVMLDRLSPEERAVFLLREAFDHRYADIATMLGTTAANCRQLCHRARRRLVAGDSNGSERPRDDRRRLAERFAAAMRAGDGAALSALLAEDVGFWSDGGGRVIAARKPLLGRSAVLNLLLGIRRTAPSAGVDLDAVSVAIHDVNHEPAMLVFVAGRLDSVYVLSTNGDAITALRVIRNPDKLVLARQLEATGRPSPA